MKKIILGLFAVLIAAQVAHGDSGFFLTAAAGQSRVSTKYTSRYTDITRSSIPQAKLDEHNLYWSIGGGYAFNDFLRVVAGYEDWGKATDASSIQTASGAAGIYPLTVDAKGVYLAYAPVLKLGLGFSLDPELGFLYSDIHIGTNYGSANGFSDPNVRSEYSVRPRYGVGLSYHLPVLPVVVGIKYLQIDLPDAKLKPTSGFYTDKIRPSTVVLTAQFSF